jgi:hypothetical protein
MLPMLLLASNVYAADIPAPPQIPARLTCPIVRVLYRKYSKTYTQEEMMHFLRSKGISEEKIEAARQCLG